MTDNFDRCLDFVLLPQNDGQPFHVTPGDPGGATAWGVTQATYSAFRSTCSLPDQSVWHMTPAERASIYRTGFWTPGLPAGVDLAVFDFAVTSGPGRSRRFLQGCVGLVGDDVDGVVGPHTLAAVGAQNAAALIDRLCAAQQAYYTRLYTFRLFGRGWTTRTEARRAAALNMERT